MGAGPMGEAERGDTAPRHRIVFWCAKGHETGPRSPPRRRSPRRGTAPAAAGRLAATRTNPPAPPRTEPYKTHLAYVRERRSDEDGEAILAEALAKLRGNGS